NDLRQMHDESLVRRELMEYDSIHDKGDSEDTWLTHRKPALTRLDHRFRHHRPTATVASHDSPLPREIRGREESIGEEKSRKKPKSLIVPAAFFFLSLAPFCLAGGSEKVGREVGDARVSRFAGLVKDSG
ncbi:hypothetical protein BHM03_00017304, partial [Ensete ventricosum]